MSAGLELLHKVITEGRIKEFGKLRPEWFAQEEQEVYQTIQKYVLTYGSLPPVSRLGALGEHQTPEPYQALYDALIDRNLSLSMAESVGEVGDLYRSGKVREAFQKMKDFTVKYDTDILSMKDTFSLTDMMEVTREYIDEARSKEGIVGIPTGWPSLDETTQGLQGGNVYVIAARPKKGKSIAMLNIMKNAHLAGYSTMMVSMEMAALEMSRRYMAMLTGLNMKKMKSGKISSEAERRMISRVQEIVCNNVPFQFIAGQFRKDISEISSIVYGSRPHLLLIDGGYLVKMAGTSRLASWERIGLIAEGVKSIAMSANIPAVISFQFNRETEGKKQVGMAQVQLSDAIGQICSVMIGIFEDPEVNTRRRIEVIGGREGEEGTFFINWDWSRMNFDELEGYDGSR